MGSIHRDTVTSQRSQKMSVIQYRLERERIFLLFRHKKGPICWISTYFLVVISIVWAYLPKGRKEKLTDHRERRQKGYLPTLLKQHGLGLGALARACPQGNPFATATSNTGTHVRQEIVTDQKEGIND